MGALGSPGDGTDLLSWVGAAGLTPATEFNRVDPAISRFHLMDEGVGPPKGRGQVNLSQSGFLSKRLQAISQRDVHRIVLRSRAPGSFSHSGKLDMSLRFPKMGNSGVAGLRQGETVLAGIPRFDVDLKGSMCHRWWATLTTTATSVQNTSLRGFGLLIAYVLPGFTVLLGLATVSNTLQVWLVGPESATLAVGGVLYVTAASIVLGMVLNALRWAILDSLHHATGLVRPVWNDAMLTERLSAFERLVEDHYRHYQFYGNTAIAAAFAFAAWRMSDAHWPSPWPELGLTALEITLVAASRDALRRYYRRTGALLTLIQENAMTNGSHHPKPAQPKADPKKPASTGAKKGDTKKS